MVVVGVVESIYGVYGKVSMVGFAEEGARVVDKKKVATVDLCGREVVDGDDKRACTRGGMKIDVLRAVEG